MRRLVPAEIGATVLAMRYPLIVLAALSLLSGCSAAGPDVVTCEAGLVPGAFYASCQMDGAPTATQEIWMGCDGPQWIVDEHGCHVYVDNALASSCTGVAPSITCANGDVMRCGWAPLPTSEDCAAIRAACPQGGCPVDVE